MGLQRLDKLKKMNGTLFLVPVALSATSPLQKFLTGYNLEVILKTNNFIVENARTARNFLSQCGKEKFKI